MTRLASDALRSYLPERRLIERRDSDALWLKYLTRFPETEAVRRWSLLNFRRQCLRPNDTTVYEPCKQLGGLVVRGDERCPADGDSIAGGPFVRLYRAEKDVVMLHVDGLHGVQAVREDLSRVAEYVRSMTS